MIRYLGEVVCGSVMRGTVDWMLKRYDEPPIKLRIKIVRLMKL